MHCGSVLGWTIWLWHTICMCCCFTSQCGIFMFWEKWALQGAHSEMWLESGVQTSGLEGTCLGCVPAVPGAWLLLSWMAQTWCQPKSTFPTAWVLSALRCLFPALDLQKSQGRWGGTGYGPIVAVLEKGTKECSEKHPQKDKQWPWKHYWPLASWKETLSVITSSSFMLKIQEIGKALQWGWVRGVGLPPGIDTVAGSQ